MFSHMDAVQVLGISMNWTDKSFMEAKFQRRRGKEARRINRGMFLVFSAAQ